MIAELLPSYTSRHCPMKDPALQQQLTALQQTAERLIAKCKVGK